MHHVQTTFSDVDKRTRLAVRYDQTYSFTSFEQSTALYSRVTEDVYAPACL